MSHQFSEDIPAHKSIYTDSPIERTIHIEYGIPEEGVNSQTGLLVVLSGYGGDASANVHRHMREDFTDKWNLIVLHIDYFGLSYMQSCDPKVKEFLSNPRLVGGSFVWVADLQENENDFNDMGIMQAIDVVYAVKYIYDKYEGIIDADKMVIFGTSHGGYLAHLANIICPELFSHIIDVSCYIVPYYLDNDRSLEMNFNDGRYVVKNIFRYHVNSFGPAYDPALYDLSFLYRQIKNKSKIIALHGTEDWMVDWQQKKSMIDRIDNAEMMLFEEKDVDGEVIKNADHGLGLDFLKFLDMYLEIIFKGSKRKADKSRLFKPATLRNLLEMRTVDDKIVIAHVKGVNKWEKE